MPFKLSKRVALSQFSPQEVPDLRPSCSKSL